MSNKERQRVDFNAVVQMAAGRPYTTADGAPLRLGNVVVDAIETASSARDPKLDSTEKLKLHNLATRIIRLDGDPPYRVLLLPERVIDRLDALVGSSPYTVGVYAEAHMMLLGDRAEVHVFDDVEEEDSTAPPTAEEADRAD